MKIFLWIWGLLLMMTSGLEAQKLVRRAVLGIEVSEKNQRVFISKVIEGTPAEKVGIRINDELVSLNGLKPQNYQEVAHIVKSIKPYESVEVVVRRNNQPLKLKTYLEELPKEVTWQYKTLYDELHTSNAILRTIITTPLKNGKYPAVIFVQGVGCYPIDTPYDTTFGHVQVLRHLSKNNIVTMRVEKSGVGDSQGEPCEKIDFQTELNHFTEALRTLKSYPFVYK
ncbi:MAG: PDZ domain-containing protein [Raineya sp.]